MKTRLKIFFGICFSLLYVACSGDSDGNAASLTVNGLPFLIGTNSADRIFNSAMQDGNHRLMVNIIEKNQPGVDAEVIQLDFNFEGISVAGTYELFPTNYSGSLPANYVSGAYNTSTLYFGNAPTDGTISITDLGNRKYKLVFNGATFFASDDSGNFKVVNGSMTASFW